MIKAITKYHADQKSVHAQGFEVEGLPHGAWCWYRKDGTLKRSGHFDHGQAIGEWITYDAHGKIYKKTSR